MASPSPFPAPLDNPLSPNFDNGEFMRPRQQSMGGFQPAPMVPTSPMFETMTDLFPPTPSGIMPSTPLGDNIPVSTPNSNPYMNENGRAQPQTPQFNTINSFPLPTLLNSHHHYSSNSSSPSIANKAPSVAPGANMFAKESGFNVALGLTETYLNRMQWYALTIRFTNANHKPVFAGRRVKFDESSVFFDARKRNGSDENDSTESVTIALRGLCAEYKKALIKCEKCIKKDRQLIMSKRKDESKKWNEDDDVNNQRLLQVVPPPQSEERIKNDGSITVKLRVSCCVGVVKQHHFNHPPEHRGEDIVAHKGCPGLAIEATAHADGFQLPSVFTTRPLHIVGKVSAADKKKGEEEEEEEEAPKQGTKRTRGQAEAELQPQFRSRNTSNSDNDMDPESESASKRLFDLARQSVSSSPHVPSPSQYGNIVPSPSYGAIAPSPSFGVAQSPGLMGIGTPGSWLNYGHPPTPYEMKTPYDMKAEAYHGGSPMTVIPSIFQADSDSLSAVILHKMLRARGHADPASALHNLALRYKKNFDTIFPTPLRDVFEPYFFQVENLRKIPHESATMFAIYSIIGCITCGMAIDIADDIWANELKLVNKFSKIDSNWSQREILLIADTHNRIGTYFGSIGSLDKARHFMTTAVEILLTYTQTADGQCRPVWESINWCKSTYAMEFDTLQESIEWAKTCNRMNAQIYSIFCLTIFLCNPDLKRDPNELGFIPTVSSIKLEQQKPLLAVISRLRELLDSAGYSRVKDGRHSYQPLFDSAFSALEYWVAGNYIAAADKVSATVLPSALLTNPQIEAYIPLYISSFVALQLTAIDKIHMVDYAELHLRQLMKINIMRWARNILDHLIKRLEIVCGEPCGLTWPELTRENCVQLGLCGPSVVVASGTPKSDGREGELLVLKTRS